MSPTPPATDPDFRAALDDFKSGGWIVSVLGGAGMVARLLLDDVQHGFMYWLRRTIAGVLVGCLCYFALWGTQLDELKKSIIMSTSGAFAPEIMERLRKKFKGGFDESQKKKRRKSRKA
jgi:hypothetical protein